MSRAIGWSAGPDAERREGKRRGGVALAIESLALLLCAPAALEIRTVVGSGRFSDDASVWLTAVSCLILLLAVGATAWTARATWRSYRSPAAVASWALPIAFAVLLCGFVWASAADVSIAMEAMNQSGDAEAPDAIIEIGPDGTDLRLDGEIKEGDAARLAKLLDANPDVTRIHLTSEGGLADEGQAIGEVIGAHRLTTFVPDYCVSACTLAFVRGRERLLMTGARLGFHAPYQQGLFGHMYEGDTSTERVRYIAAGVAPDFADRALKVASEDMWFPTAAQLIAAHVATGSVDRYTFPDSSLDESATLEAARRQILADFPLAAAFQRRSPHALDRIADWYVAAYDDGLSEGDVSDGLKVVLGSAVDVALGEAADATQVQVARYLAAAMDVAATDAACVRIGSEANLVQAERERLRLGAGPGAGDLVAAVLAGGRATAAAADRSVAHPWPASRSPASCADLKAAYRDLLARPPHEVAARMRTLVIGQSSRLLSALSELRQAH